jgi:Tol biopolymer transport system component
MTKYSRSVTVSFLLAIVIGACASPIPAEQTQLSLDQEATTSAMLPEAVTPEFTETPANVVEESSSLLPHRLYFLGIDDQAINQIFLMDQDGKSVTQLTFESANVSGYDVSMADGRIAYEVADQLVLIDADGSNRRVLVEAKSDPGIPESYHPTFSPDGQTLAYGENGLNLYDLSSGVSKLVIENQYGEPLPDGARLPIELYWPEKYSPDGKKLLVALGHWEVAPSHAVYYPDSNTMVRYAEVQDYIYCCSFHGGPVWSPDSTSFSGVASAHDYAYQSGELWKVDAGSGALTRNLKSGDGMINLPRELYLAPDGQLYFFFGTYDGNSGYFDAPVLNLVRSAPDGVTDRTVLRDENFVMMKDALWAPDASFVIVSSAPGQNWDQDAGVLELYSIDRQKSPVWLAPSGEKMKWGP